MAYAVLQTALAGVIQKITGYDANNCVENDIRALGHGKDLAVVLYPSSMTQRLMTVRDSTVIDWQCDVHLFVNWDGEQSSSVASLMAERQKILDEINKWPFLDAQSGIQEVMVISMGDVEEVRYGSLWLRQILTVMIREMNTFARSE